MRFQNIKSEMYENEIRNHIPQHDYNEECSGSFKTSITPLDMTLDNFRQFLVVQFTKFHDYIWATQSTMFNISWHSISEIPMSII